MFRINREKKYYVIVLNDSIKLMLIANKYDSGKLLLEKKTIHKN